MYFLSITQSTTWVKKESELEAVKAAADALLNSNNNGVGKFLKTLPPWMTDNKLLENVKTIQDDISLQAKNLRQKSCLPFIRLRSSFKGI